MRLLGIETSCDDTAAAVVTDGCIVESSVLASQDEFHRAYGGIVPEIASRKHAEMINAVIELALQKAGRSFADLDGVAVTCGPGLPGSLVVGVAAAQALCTALRLPAYAVNHLHGHIFANYLGPAPKGVEPPPAPFLCLIVSGGHTDLVLVETAQAQQVIGRTVDDAAGEAYDKVARLLGLGFPGGPVLDSLAQHGNPAALAFPRGLTRDGTYNFSFSGLKTAVRYHLDAHPLDPQLSAESLHARKADIAASFQQAVVDSLCDKTLKAARDLGQTTVALAGGVAANSALRSQLTLRAQALGIDVRMPPLEYCTDNAAMIASAAFYLGEQARVRPAALRIDPNFAW
ncbi:MAG: tRNA (adenosine(37)-N6)-threonylcarbamoyltransferase complex transferase subunit TsaD [Candidatus Eremiobacter antarcticus]|nr:tRNA (adenosine(37)-N6)-threonylcarbamoyltransferase complex transferase subunit TsaD [Candidatus Eremiobacteraeota bacterium]MBC5809053.1 tRNA (adenosine(37)-N6)-threonylcarbamoyltransferase complex transferase subunit TsaD [Candidatus Eremiobacteraeota bacterium]PZR64285.1 MAG: tRNA (adenosine(37)-N6)-threonylcarbamoyltransferase complex transferase subunit TsaD [Candidatus Eremiobacter sp. RRmetagenome_bin22]